MPVADFMRLSGPDMVEFWQNEAESTATRNLRRVIVLEDAEAMLMKRSSDNRTATAHLLNTSDGLMGEFFRFHLICSINCEADRLDPALLRPGRLIPSL